MLPVPAQAAAFADKGPLQTDTGHVLISWQAEGPVTLEMARDPGFAHVKPIYLGMNHAHFISGLANGAYYLRLRDANGTESPPLELTVRHQSLRQALWLALIGVIVTLAVIATVLRGARDD
ncbi:MAG: hypothetical protein R3E09_03940 [Novosphingobium sp.]